ncbi:MAG: cytochrome c-type biogenesis protein [Terriglobales bacterium]
MPRISTRPPGRALIALAILAMFAAGLKGDPIAQRYQRLAAKLRCVCPCHQSMLSECNNMQCSARAQLDAAMVKLSQKVRSNDSDSLILQAFVQEFGPDVLAAPPTRGFSLIVWVMPWLAAGLGIWALLYALRRWRSASAAASAGSAAAPPDPALTRVHAEVERELEDWERRT